MLKSLEPAEVKKTLKAHAFAHFPAMQGDKLAGIATRAELTEAIAEKRPPKLAPIVRCEPRQTIRQLQGRLIESPTGMAVVCDAVDGKLLGLVTLHDLLRAQINAAQSSP